MAVGDLAIEASGLVKTFSDVRAVDGVDLAVRAGGVYGFLGPNGAGKTTTIRMLATLLTPDAGTARVLGHDVVANAHEVRRRVSLTGQFASVDEDLTGSENLVLLGKLLGRDRARARARARRSCSRRSAWRTPPAGRSRPGRAGCAGGWTSRPASWSRRT
jgi:ABC-2 type transport system ATP-binding protein